MQGLADAGVSLSIDQVRHVFAAVDSVACSPSLIPLCSMVTPFRGISWQASLQLPFRCCSACTTRQCHGTHLWWLCATLSQVHGCRLNTTLVFVLSLQQPSPLAARCLRQTVCHLVGHHA